MGFVRDAESGAAENVAGAARQATDEWMARWHITTCQWSHCEELEVTNDRQSTDFRGRPGNGLFAGPGEMRARCRAFDWASTQLGPVSDWSASLRTIVATLLASRHPMFLWWGPELVQIFNDGYLPSFGGGGRDLAALGARGREHWAEIWDVIGPQIEGVMTLRRGDVA